MMNTKIGRVPSIKEKVWNQVCIIYASAKENIKDINICSVEEKIGLWQMTLTSNETLYFYTNIRGEIIFNGQLFSYASPFSKGCALVRACNKYYLININKNKLIEIPENKINCQNIRPIKNGNLAVLGENNRWGSYYFDAEKSTFTSDIPFIWDALDFSKEGKNLYAGLFSFKNVEVDDVKNWASNKLQLQLKIACMTKEEGHNFKAYQRFLKENYANETVDYLRNQKIILQEKKQDLNAYRKKAFPLETQTNYTTLIPSAREVVSVGNLEEYQLVRGRVK